MAITLIIEDGSIVEDANTYVDSAGAFATAYFEAHLYATTWTAATSEQKKAAVVQATRTIDSLITWKGRKTDQDQPRQWPRYQVFAEGFLVPDDQVPRAVQEATLEMAMALLERNRLADSAATQGVNALKLGQGALELELTPDKTTELKAIPDIVRQLLEPYGMTKGGGMKPVFRA